MAQLGQSGVSRADGCGSEWEALQTLKAKGLKA